MKSFTLSFIRQIIISSVPAMLCIQLLSALGTQASIIGRITDDAGEPLPGTTIVVKNNAGVVSVPDGTPWQVQLGVRYSF